MAVVTANTQVIGVLGDDLTLDSVQTILENSPLLIYAAFIRDLAIKNKIRVSFVLAQMLQESALGTAGIALTAYNPAGMRSSVSGLGTVRPTLKGDFVFFNGWADGIREQIAHSTAPDSVYVKEGRKTIRQIVEKWSPASDGNRTEEYIANVVKWMNQWTQGEGNMFDLNNIPFRQSPNYDKGGNSRKKIIIHSTEGSYGSSVGWLLSPAAQASAHYVINEDGSQCTQLVRDEDVAWHAGNYTYNQMCIGIEHSWFSDGRNGPPPDSLYQAGAKLTALLCQKYGITPNRGNILAHGEVPPPNDHTDPGPRWDWAKFMAYVVQAYQGGNNHVSDNVNGQTVPPTADPNVIQLNGFAVGHGFLNYFNKYGGVKFFGLPLSNEQVNPRTNLVEQCFERYVLEYQPDADPDWQVRGKDIGRFYLTNRGF